ncbi:MAG TPA: glycosyltransferase family 4 protein [Chthoniobacterales bacterium]|nr:glycosyltransferase family 4 protein [Chthoniobacterales bacterium]
MNSAVNSSMLRIGYIFERFPSFGQTFCYREVVELKRQGAEVSVFSIRTPAGEPRQDWDEQVVRNVHYLPDEAELVKEIDDAIRQRDLPAEAVSAISKWDRQSDFLRLYQAAYVGSRLRAAGITRVHAHFAGMAARTAYWIKRFFGIDYSLTAHANDIFAPRDFVVSLSKIVDSAAAVVTVSDFAAARLQEQFPENAPKIRRVYNGVDLGAVDPSQFSGDPPLIVSVGRLIEKKGFGDLISACALLKSHGLRFRCEIIGEGPLDAALSAHIRDLQLTKCVELLGPRTQGEIAQRFRAATMFVLACTTEADGGMDNLPTVIMEAMAAGLPVISTPLAGVPEMVEQGASGELVPQRNPVALASAIERLLADPAAAARLGARGREVAAEKFSIEVNVRRLAQVLDGC